MNYSVNTNPSEEINSVYSKSAPSRLEINLKGGSVTSSIGARARALVNIF